VSTFSSKIPMLWEAAENTSMRRTLLIAALIIVLLGVGVAVYFYFFAKSPGVEVSPDGGGLPVAGESSAPIEGGGAESSSEETPVPISVSNRLVKIAPGPIVPGMVLTASKPKTASSSSELLLQFIERKSGNVYLYSVPTRTLTRINNKTVLGLQSAAWLPSGTTAYTRYLSDSTSSTVNTYALSATTSQGFFLPQNLSDIDVSSTSILMVASGVNGSTGTLARSDGTQGVTVFSTPLTSIRSSFLGKTNYLAFTKPSALLPGYAFSVSGGTFSRIAGPYNGLVALASHNGTWVLISFTAGEDVRMELRNLSTGETVALPIATIADKCVWASDDSAVYCGIPKDLPSANYPDDWYQGETHFSDRIWRIQVEGRYAQLILDVSKEAEMDIDIESPAIDPTSTAFVFINKNDGSLWSYAL
jgi:hypothetical protein